MANLSLSWGLQCILVIAPFLGFAASQYGPLLDFTSPNALPSCATQCQPLYAAQYACIPPQAPIADPLTYQACFCRSPILQPLYSRDVGICDGICPPEQLAQIRNWYLGRCPQRNAVTVTVTSSPSATATATRSAPTRVSISTSSPVPGTESQPGSWFEPCLPDKILYRR